jgi:hypothetical protein
MVGEGHAPVVALLLASEPPTTASAQGTTSWTRCSSSRRSSFAQFVRRATAWRRSSSAPSEDADAPDSEKHDVTRLHRSSRCRLPQAQVWSSLEDVAVHIKGDRSAPPDSRPLPPRGLLRKRAARRRTARQQGKTRVDALLTQQVRFPMRVEQSSWCPSASTVPSRRCSRSTGRSGCCGLGC